MVWCNLPPKYKETQTLRPYEEKLQSPDSTNLGKASKYKGIDNG